MKISIRPLVAAGVVALAAGSCIARSEGRFEKQTADDGGPKGPINLDGGVTDAKGELPPMDPHAVLGVEPPHGPWNGGQTVIVRGNGFTSKVRIWFGTLEVAAADLLPIDAERVQITVPPGTTGAVDVIAQNGDDTSTRRTLIGGYTYDSFYAEPASGPTGGGTLIELHGQATKWNDNTKVFIDLLPCTEVKTSGPTELTCKSPASTPGTKPIRVTTEDDVSVDVLDAFTYGDSDNGYKGGLSGSPLTDELKVLVLDSYTGDVVPGSTVIVGTDVDTALIQKTDNAGVTVFNSPDLGPKKTVTIAKKCYQPLTFVDVPVSTVTAYVDAVLSPSCASEGDPPPVGGTPALGAAIQGELVWKSQKEFEKRAAWTNIPEPKSADERAVAYVFELSTDPTDEFTLPSPSDAVTPDGTGTVGYDYTLSTSTGNLGLYAIAGIENRSANPPYFKAYAMGVAKGVAANPGGYTTNVYISMDIPLDHAFKMSLTGPKPTAKGPDRAQATIAIRVGELGYAILPAGFQERLLPVGSPLSFVGIPPLAGGLASSQYVYTASAVTGASATTPRSISGLVATNTTSETIVIDEFVEIPSLAVPGTNGVWSGTELTWGATPGGASVELTVITIQSAGGLVNWLVAAPAGVTSTPLPDLAKLSSDLALIPGAITIGVTRAHIDPFDYGSLRYRQLDSRGWNAYAEDIFFAHY